MLFDYKAKSPLEAFQKMVQVVCLTYDKSYLALHLPKAVLKDYHNGAFTLEMPNTAIAQLLSPHAELSIIRRTLEDYMPDGIPVSVQIVAKDGQP